MLAALAVFSSGCRVADLVWLWDAECGAICRLEGLIPGFAGAHYWHRQPNLLNCPDVSADLHALEAEMFSRHLFRKQRHRVCVVAEFDVFDLAQEDLFAWWPQENTLQSLDRFFDSKDPEIRHLGAGRRTWRPGDGVVAADAEVGTSTWLVTRAWFDAKVAACSKRGNWFLVASYPH